MGGKEYVPENVPKNVLWGLAPKETLVGGPRRVKPEKG